MEKELEKTGFDLVALPLPNAKFFNKERLPATYLNFVFINNALIIPTYNDKNDKKVVKILEEKIKDRVIKTIDSSILIREHGSLHCSSTNNMLQL
jgi:agmatine/peptidylarginine deiminase